MGSSAYDRNILLLGFHLISTFYQTAGQSPLMHCATMITSMRLCNYGLLLSLFSLLMACSTKTEKSQLEQQEDAYWQNPSTETGQALIATYEGLLDTLQDASMKLQATQKAALMYFRVGASEGLQSNFSSLLNNFQEMPESLTAAQQIMDTVLYSITDPKTQRLTPGVARQYMSLANIYAKSKPDASESPEMLYKAGEIARSIGAYQEALNIYATIESYFPQYEKAPKALFMQAFTYAEDLNNEEQARTLYERFIEKYPNDDFVDDAQILLETLGKSDEEIFQQLESQ